MTQRLAFEILHVSFTNKLAAGLKGTFYRATKYVPGLKYDLIKADYNISAADYVGFSFFNSAFLSSLSLIILFLLSFLITKRTLYHSAAIGIIAALGIFILFFIAMLRYPSIEAGKISEKIDKNLVYGLKDLLLQVSSSIPLHNAVANVAAANYGQISVEFGKATKNIKTGMPLADALEKMAIETKSKFLKRAVWQMVNSIRSGTSMKGALQTVIQELMNEQKNSIKNYAKELNLWTLIYMLFAVAIPSIGGTLLIVLSSFAGAGISKASFVFFLVFGFMVQIALIEFINSRRPAISL